MHKIALGLDQLAHEGAISQSYKSKNVALLAHNASRTSQGEHALSVMHRCFGDQFIKAFGPQHGLVTDLQDNMKESKHFTHPHFNIPVYSLYSETRVPSDEMLEGVEVLFVDLQDIGSRVYTYIYTLTLLLEKVAHTHPELEVVILDRPNPVGLEHVEGNILNLEYASFVGRHSLAVRHGMTMGEIALWHQKYVAQKKAKLSIIEVKNLKRSDLWTDFQALSWQLPSPNIPCLESCYSFIGNVLFEGTKISEGRGTTRPFDYIGHPKIETFSFLKLLKERVPKKYLEHIQLHEAYFRPTFQKHANQTCQGVYLSITNLREAKLWPFGHYLLRTFHEALGDDFQYNTEPYEYEDKLMAIDLINGDDRFKDWYQDHHGKADILELVDFKRFNDFLEQRKSVFLYQD